MSAPAYPSNKAALRVATARLLKQPPALAEPVAQPYPALSGRDAFPRANRDAFVAPCVIVLRPAQRDLTSLLGSMRERHGLSPMNGGGGVYPDILQLEATLRLLEANPTIGIPAENRRLVEGSIHPEVTLATAEKLGTAWLNHVADCAGMAHADRGVAEDLPLDLSTPLRDLIFPNVAGTVATRLGARPAGEFR